MQQYFIKKFNSKSFFFINKTDNGRTCLNTNKLNVSQIKYAQYCVFLNTNVLLNRLKPHVIKDRNMIIFAIKLNINFFEMHTLYFISIKTLHIKNKTKIKFSILAFQLIIDTDGNF